MQRNIRSLLLVLIFAGGFWAAVWQGPRIVFEASEVSGWPSVVGTVKSSHSEHRDGGKNSDDSWVIVVRYRYEVDGDLYAGDRWTVDGPRKARDEAQALELRQAYSAQDPIEVRYDPDDPGQAVIEEGGALKGWLMIGFGLLLLGLGAFVAFRRLAKA